MRGFKEFKVGHEEQLMGREVLMEFDTLYGNTVTSHVRVFKGGKVEFVDYVDDTMLNAFGSNKHPDIDAVEELFRARCFDIDRPDRAEILQAMGLYDKDDKYDGYCPFDIVQVTHGVLMQDMFWIRFKGEYLTFEDVTLPYRRGEV